MNQETALQNRIRMALSKVGILNWRNNTGMGWSGKMIRGTGNMMKVGKQDVVVYNARPLRAGLCEGSSDIIGIKEVTITPEMVGETIGQFVAVEVKTPGGKVKESQTIFCDAVNSKGGKAEVVRSIGEAERLA